MTDTRRKCVFPHDVETPSERGLPRMGGSVAYENVLAAAVILTLTISALGMFVIGPAGGPISGVAAAESDVRLLDRTNMKTVPAEPSERGIPIDPSRGRVDFYGPQGHDDSAVIGR